jgi:hypothetical protein
MKKKSCFIFTWIYRLQMRYTRFLIFLFASGKLRKILQIKNGRRKRIAGIIYFRVHILYRQNLHRTGTVTPPCPGDSI